MKFIQPKGKNRKKSTWYVSEQTKSLIKYYAQYTEYTEDEVVDIFLQNILLDEDFMKWVENKRYNKRILEQIKPNNSDDIDEEDELELV
ncbi:hypothetical protein [Priestia koreensis]|uniref:hypothetical protein n=1 Tax=Priestia koreensis TaxID=284581 RepID=UPI0020415F8B|nr:hypothetical protein [Priestia koreensis]MCM3007024.1 hypothetical protein [Priestia koreensis]